MAAGVLQDKEDSSAPIRLFLPGVEEGDNKAHDFLLGQVQLSWLLGKQFTLQTDFQN